MRSLFAALLLLTSSTTTFCALAADSVRLPAAWRAGETLVYDSEMLQQEKDSGGTIARRITDRTEVEVEAAEGDGMIATSTTFDSRVEAVEGDRTITDMLAPMFESFDAYPVRMDLDRNGHFRGIRDMDAVTKRVREGLLPVYLAAIDRMAAAQSGKLSKFDLETIVAAARDNVEASLAESVTPASVEVMVGGTMRTISSFSGRTFEVARTYRDREPMLAELDGRTLPAQREFTLSLDRKDPNLVRVRWVHTLDTEGDAEALWALVDQWTDRGSPKANRGRPRDLSLREEGMLLIRRDTGAIEMAEIVTTSRYGELHDEREVTRLRLRGASRSWAEEDAARAR